MKSRRTCQTNIKSKKKPNIQIDATTTLGSKSSRVSRPYAWREHFQVCGFADFRIFRKLLMNIEDLWIRYLVIFWNTSEVDPVGPIFHWIFQKSPNCGSEHLDVSVSFLNFIWHHIFLRLNISLLCSLIGTIYKSIFTNWVLWSEFIALTFVNSSFV